METVTPEMSSNERPSASTELKIMRTKSKGAFLLLIFGLLFSVDAHAFQLGQRSPLEWAEELVANIQPEDTDYQHKHGTVNWKGIDGSGKYESHTDCSGLLNHLLAQSYGLKQGDLEVWLGVRRPLAITYHDAIESKNGFARIEHVADVRPGDVIAIKYPPDADNSGHIMIVAEQPRRRQATGTIVDGTEQWEITVIDSSESGHGKTDTRRTADGTFGQGVGKGVFRLYTDARGNLIGYAWSTFANSDYHGQDDRHLVVGRLKVAGFNKK